MAKPEDVCRLCLNTISNCFETLDNHKVVMLQSLCLNLDLSLMDKPIVCLECRDILQQSYNFKTTCLNSGNYSGTFPSSDGNIRVNLEETIHRNAVQTGIKLEEESICRFCLKYLDDDSFVKTIQDQDTFLTDMFHKCVPELQPGIINRLSMCLDCMVICQKMFDFLTNCLNNEEKIKEYLQRSGTTSNSQISLTKALKLIGEIKNDNSVANNLDFIKQETFKQELSNTVYDGVKTEFEQLEEDKIDVKIEEASLLENRAPNDPKSSKENTALTSKGRADTTVHKNTEYSYESNYKSFLQKYSPNRKGKYEVTTHYCMECSYTTKDKNSLHEHVSTHFGPSVHKCTQCSYESERKCYLQKHMLTHKDKSEVVTYKCTECSYESKYKHSLRNHLLTHKDNTEVALYKCTECSFESKHRCNLWRHSLVHQDESEVAMHKCTKCSFKSKHRCSLKVHSRLHKDASVSTVDESEIEMHKCTVCGFQSKYKRCLRRHLRNVHKLLL